MVCALAEHLRVRMKYEIADWRFVWHVDASIQGGRQDQYATAFGGFNFIEFEPGKTVVNPLRIRPDVRYELEYGLVFAYVGGTHFSSHIIERQVGNYREGLPAAVEAMDRLKELAHEMRRALLLGDLPEFGRLLDAAWQAKREMAEGITNERLDAIYAAARKSAHWAARSVAREAAASCSSCASRRGDSRCRKRSRATGATWSR
jgi:D-glycero-alpha-D-manno-heptose-7-phosphate kinase